MWVAGSPWSLRFFNIVFPSTVQMFSQFWIFYFSILRSFLYQLEKIVYTDLALPLRKVLLRPLYGLLPNKMGFLHLSYSQMFFPENSFYSFNWVFLTAVRGNQFRCRRPYMGYTITTVYVFVCRYLYFINSTSSAVLIRVTSPQHRL